jgi:hypothetical protein
MKNAPAFDIEHLCMYFYFQGTGHPPRVLSRKTSTFPRGWPSHMQMLVEVEVEVAHCPSRIALRYHPALQLQLQFPSFENVVEWYEDRAGIGSHPDAYKVQ